MTFFMYNCVFCCCNFVHARVLFAKLVLLLIESKIKEHRGIPILFRNVKGLMCWISLSSTFLAFIYIIQTWN
jgi:hypothetical protein